MREPRSSRERAITPGYTLQQGSLTELPILSADERESLIEAAWSLNRYQVPTVGSATATDTHGQLRPGDDFNQRGEVRDVLRRHGWVLVRSGQNEYWRRPDKTSGRSATFKDRVFYVFSANAAPIEPNHAYSPFAVFAFLEHGGDYEAAARDLRTEGYGSDDVSLPYSIPPAICSDDDIPSPEPITQPNDPGPMPEHMLRIPGFVSEVMDYCLATAPYLNQVMAFSGALALQAFLAGRKVRDPGDNRTNLYLLGLAHSAAGKDWPRKINTRILHEIGLADCTGERFASGEGIQDSLFRTPAMLFQTDEIDGLLQSINKAQDARHENILGTLLTMYSAANSIFPMRRKAGKESPGVIDQPCLVVYGTAIPTHYYSALSERMLTNGFFARMIILECGRRGTGQEPTIAESPDRVLETARWWNDYRPGQGNLQDWHPIPAVVPHTDEAKQILVAARIEAEYERAEANNDAKTELPSALSDNTWGRCAAIKPGASCNETLYPWYWNVDLSFALAPGVSCYRAGIEYTHGGLSLQECVVTYLTVMATTAAGGKSSIEIQDVAWRGMRCKVAIEGFVSGLRLDIRTHAGNPSSTVTMSDRPFKEDGTASVVVEDENLADHEATIVIVDAQGHLVAERGTVIGKEDI